MGLGYVFGSSHTVFEMLMVTVSKVRWPDGSSEMASHRSPSTCAPVLKPR